MKKTSAVILMFLCATSAFAAEANEDLEVPREATLIYQASWDTSYLTVPLEKEDVVSAMESEIQKRESRMDVEPACQAIYYKWDYKSELICHDSDSWVAGGCLNPLNQIFSNTRFYTARKISVRAFCQPRGDDATLPTVRYDIGKP